MTKIKIVEATTLKASLEQLEVQVVWTQAPSRVTLISMGGEPKSRLP